ncbi:hypothetical protein V2W30_21185 [Streptomyces sp. Q6]|uniref:Uncharacterized protein n=1 Tax=Streptomyces citrinus TaxID=3118173 RepID=A0ACD5AEE2_9ACTN
MARSSDDADATAPTPAPAPARRLRLGLTLSVAVAAVVGLGIGVPALAGSADSADTAGSAGRSVAPTPELPGKELPGTPAGTQFGGAWTSLLDETDAPSMMRLDIPATATKGDAVRVLVGRSGAFCTAEGRITSRKKHHMTVDTAPRSDCLPEPVTLENLAGTVMWRASADHSIQIDRASGPTSRVPAALVGTWRDGDDTVRVTNGGIGDTVVSGTRTVDGTRCSWSARLMDTAPFQSSPTTHPIALAPAISTTPACKAPYQAYRLQVEDGELTRWSTATTREDHFARVE